jgi:hypothetical protein
MIPKLAGHFIGELATRLGWLFLLCGLILPGMQAFDTLTASEAVARITEVRTLCNMQTSIQGRKSWRQFPCTERADVEATGTSVRTKGWAKLAFSGADGVVRTVWKNFGKLEIEHAEVGQQLPILYRGNNDPYVARPFDWRLAGIGFAISIGGLMLLGVARRMRHDTSDANDRVRSPPGKDKGQAQYQAGMPRPRAVTVADPARLAKSPQRVPVVQRARGWLG